MHSIHLHRLPDGSYSAHSPENNLACRRPGRAAALHLLCLALEDKIPRSHPDLCQWPEAGHYAFLEAYSMQEMARVQFPDRLL